MTAPAVIPPLAFTDDSDRSGTTLTVNLPAGLQAGETLIVFLSKRNGAGPVAATPTGYTSLYDDTVFTLFAQCFYRKCDGTEGTTQVFTLTDSATAEGVAYRIDLADDPLISPPEFNLTLFAQSATNTSTCPNISPSGGVDDYLYIPHVHKNTYTQDITSFPPGLSNTYENESGIGGQRVQSAGGDIQALGSSGSGTFDFVWSGTAASIAATVAINPVGGPPAAGRIMSSMVNHGGLAYKGGIAGIGGGLAG